MHRLFFTLFFLVPVMAGHRKGPTTRPEAIIGCGPAGPTSILPDADGRFAPVFPGWGHYHYSIVSTSDSAQYYFDQGLSLYYSYHLTESAASFREAAAKDSRCLMAYWGQALAMGPYYNSTYSYKMPWAVLPVIDRMNDLAAGGGTGAGDKEKDLVSAMNTRYSTDTSDRRRASLNSAYSAAMKRLVAKYPDDNDIKALYIDAVMCEHAWDMWDRQGEPRPWTRQLVSYCEGILARDPDHPAALHYHIHLLEASFHAEATLVSADRLRELMPGVPHMVHMASHTYQRTGLYAKGVLVNDAANAAQDSYRMAAPHLQLAVNVIHYDAVQAFCAMNGAMYEKAMAAAMKCRRLVASRSGVVNNNLQFLSSMALFALVRMGKWQEILDQPIPEVGWVYASLLSNFARGMAFAHMGRGASAQACLDSLRVLLKDPSLTERQLPFNAAVKPALVAEAILEGEILFSQGRQEDAVTAFKRGVRREHEMTYLEPNEWPLPARQYEGLALLRSGKSKEAEKVYVTDIVENPGNGWSLLGLYQSLGTRNSKAAANCLARAKTAFASAEAMPPASVY